MRLKFGLVILLFGIILLPCINAIGITPARTTVNFEPGLEKQVSISVINSEGKDVNLVVAVQGELADYVTLEKTSFSIPSSQNSKNIGYSIKLPSELSPGLHTADIIVLQLPDTGELDDAFIGAAVAVVSQLHIYVSYPGKYAEADLNVLNLNDENIQFVIPVLSRGDFDISSVKQL